MLCEKPLVAFALVPVRTSYPRVTKVHLIGWQISLQYSHVFATSNPLNKDVIISTSGSRDKAARSRGNGSSDVGHSGKRS